MRKTYILFILLIAFVYKASVAQDSQFSQFYASPLYLAPSFAGSTDGDRVSANYRSQWPSISKAFQTYSLSYDHYFPHLKSGVGLLLYKEQAGASNLSTMNVGLAYSYKFKFRKPDKRIFQIAAERIGEKVSNIIFIGDRIDNDIKGALKVGMFAAMKKAYTNIEKRTPAESRKSREKYGNCSCL